MNVPRTVREWLKIKDCQEIQDLSFQQKQLPKKKKVAVENKRKSRDVPVAFKKEVFTEH